MLDFGPFFPRTNEAVSNIVCGISNHATCPIPLVISRLRVVSEKQTYFKKRKKKNKISKCGIGVGMPRKFPHGFFDWACFPELTCSNPVERDHRMPGSES